MKKKIHSQTYRDFALCAAEDLQYDQKVMDQIKAAKSDSEIERIMIAARKEKEEAETKPAHYFRRITT